MIFDFKRLYEDTQAVLDRQGRSWREAAKELGIARATLQRMSTGNGIGVTHVAKILRFVGAKFETYVVNPKRSR